MIVKTGFEIEEWVRLSVESMKKEFYSIPSRRILVVANSSIARLFGVRAPLVPEATLSIFCNYKPGREGITEWYWTKSFLRLWESCWTQVLKARTTKKNEAECVPAPRWCSHKTVGNRAKNPLLCVVSHWFDTFGHYLTPDFILRWIYQPFQHFSWVLKVQKWMITTTPVVATPSPETRHSVS